MQAGGVERTVSVGGVKPEEAEDTQIVFSDAGRGIADEADAPVAQIGEAADIVVERAVGRSGQGIDGEVAPLGIRPPIAPETDRRLRPKVSTS